MLQGLAALAGHLRAPEESFSPPHHTIFPAQSSAQWGSCVWCFCVFLWTAPAKEIPGGKEPSVRDQLGPADLTKTEAGDLFMLP